MARQSRTQVHARIIAQPAVALALLAGVALLSDGVRADSHRYSVRTSGPNPSALNGSVRVQANFAGTMIGTYTAQNTTGSRTITPIGNPFLPPPGPPRNDPIPINGVGGTNQSSPGNPVPITTVPGGTFNMLINVPALRVVLSNLDLNLLGASPPPTLTTGVSMSYTSFRTANPAYLYPFLVPILLPLDSATLLEFRLVQLGTGQAPLIPTQTAGVYTFTLQISVETISNVEFQGTEFPSQVTGLLQVNGTVTIAGPGNPQVTLEFSQSDQQTIDPVEGTPFPFDLPAPTTGSPPVPVIMNINITGGTVQTSGSVTLPTTRAALAPADIAQTDGSPGPDGQRDNGDFVLFIASFFAPDDSPLAYAADIASTDATPGSDGQRDNGDFQVFIASFFGP
jgi:hypothetical protein